MAVHRVKRIRTVQKRLHLAAHLIVIYRCGKTDGISLVHLPHDRRSIVILDHTLLGLLADQTAFAETYVLSS